MADNLLDFGSDDDMFGGSIAPGPLNKSTSKSLDDILGMGANADLDSGDDLDELLQAETINDNELFEKPKKIKKKTVKQTDHNLFGDEEELDIFAPTQSTSEPEQTKNRANTGSSVDDFFDSLMNEPSIKSDDKPRSGSFLDDFDDLLQNNTPTQNESVHRIGNQASERFPEQNVGNKNRAENNLVEEEKPPSENAYKSLDLLLDCNQRKLAETTLLTAEPDKDISLDSLLKEQPDGSLDSLIDAQPDEAFSSSADPVGKPVKRSGSKLRRKLSKRVSNIESKKGNPISNEDEKVSPMDASLDDLIEIQPVPFESKKVDAFSNEAKKPPEQSVGNKDRTENNLVEGEKPALFSALPDSSGSEVYPTTVAETKDKQPFAIAKQPFEMAFKSLDLLLDSNQIKLAEPALVTAEPDKDISLDSLLKAQPDGSLDSLIDAQPDEALSSSADPVGKPVKRSGSKLRRKLSKRVSNIESKKGIASCNEAEKVSSMDASLDGLIEVQPVSFESKKVDASSNEAEKISSADASLDDLIKVQPVTVATTKVSDDLDSILEVNISTLSVAGSDVVFPDLGKPAGDLDALLNVNAELEASKTDLEKVAGVTGTATDVNKIGNVHIFESKDDKVVQESTSSKSPPLAKGLVPGSVEEEQQLETSPEPVRKSREPASVVTKAKSVQEVKSEQKKETGVSARKDSDRQKTKDKNEEQAVKVSKKKKPKRAMEKSFEDLLNGLSDESEPELDEMIDDDMDNTNLESLLGTPNKSYRSLPNNHDSLTTTPGQSNTLDTMTSTPKPDKQDLDLFSPSARVKVTSPEIKVHTPEDDEEQVEEEDVKSSSPMESDYLTSSQTKEDIGDEGEVEEEVEEKEQGEFDKMSDSNQNCGGSKADSSDDDIDLSAISDTNHLDVQVTKHKSTLSKKGSLARRRSQTRQARKSLLSTGDDAIFQDSTDPKPSPVVNGDKDGEEEEEEKVDMTPHAKKRGPSGMVPLPGLSARAPHQGTPMAEDEPSTSEMRRVSKPPPGAFRLPGLHTTSGDKPKPQPRPPKPSSQSQEESQAPFDQAGLKSVSPQRRSREPSQEAERDMMFEKPVLRQTPKSGQGKADEKISTNTGIFPKPTLRNRSRETSQEAERDVKFEKPALRQTPKPGRERSEERMDTNSGIFPKPQLRSITKPDTNTPIPDRKTSQEDTPSVFDTPLRPTGRSLVSDRKEMQSESNQNQNASTFEKPPLRSTRRDMHQQSDHTENKDDSSKHIFEKPSLRSTPTKKRDNTSNTGEDEPMGVFDKPSLKKADSVDKESKDAIEPKGVFEKPALRTTPSPEKETKGVAQESKVVFGRALLKKTDRSKLIEEKNKAAEKPEWLQAAASKGSKVLDALQAKENKSTESKPVPSWLEKDSLRKGQPLQDTSNSQSESSRDRAPSSSSSRSREPSIGSDMEVDKARSRGSSVTGDSHNNYSPSWARQTRASSMSHGSPGSVPMATDSEEVPQWRKDLHLKRLKRKEQSPLTEEQARKEESSEPEWKRNTLRKVRPAASSSRDTHSVEPEWKKAAEEKHARLRNHQVHVTGSSDQSEC